METEKQCVDDVIQPAYAFSKASGEAISWEYDIPLVNNLFILRDFLFVICASMVVMQLLVLAMGLVFEGEVLLLPWQVWGIVIAVIGVLFLVAALVVLGNRYHARFTVNQKQVLYEAGIRERKMNRVMVALGMLALLAGKPGPAGAALLSTSQEALAIGWRDVHRVRVYSNSRVISLSNSWRTVVRLYCPAEMFDQIVELVKKCAAEGEVYRKRHSQPTVWPWRRWLIWGAVTVAPALASMAWSDNLRAGTGWLIFLTAAVVLASGLLAGTARRLLGSLGIVASLGLALTIITTAVGPASSRYSWLGAKWQYDTPFLAVTLIGVLAMLLLAAYQSFARQR
jgi:hypothetical protein